MALDSKNNIKSVFIMPSITTVTSPAVGVKVTPGSTPTGWVGITNMSNEVLDTTEVVKYDKIKIIKDRGADNPLQQVVLSLSDIAKTSAYSGAFATEQVSYIGNNGSTGNLSGVDSINNNFFIIKLEHTPNSFIYGKRPASYKYATYQSTDSDTEIEVAEGLVKSLITNFRANRSTDWRVRSEVVCDAALNAVPTLTSIALTRYSRSAIVTGSMSSLSVGTAIRIADAGATVKNTQTPVYVITAINGQTITLNYAYQGPSGSTTAAFCDLVVGYIGSFPGIKITGIKQKYDVNRWRQYDKVRFGIYLEGFGTSTPVQTTAAFDGVAVYEQAANDEYISWGDEGQVFVDQVPPLFREQDAQVGIQYNPVVISWLNRLNSLIGAGENKGQVIVYMAGGDGAGDFAPTENQVTFVDVFNAWVPANLDLVSPFPDSTV